MIFRISTKNKNQEAIEKLAGKYFEGFTILKADGFWRLQKENSLVIEVDTGLGDKEKVNQLAIEIKTLNQQEAVLVQEIKNNSWLV